MLLNTDSFNFEGWNDDNSSGISLEEAYHLGIEVFSYTFSQLRDSEQETFLDKLDSIT